MDIRLFLRAGDELGVFSSLRDLVRGGLEKERIEICSPDLYLRIRPLKDIFIASDDKRFILTGPVFQAELLGLTTQNEPMIFDSLKNGFHALLTGVVDYLQLYEMSPVGINYQILFLKQGGVEQIRFSSGDYGRKSAGHVLTWVDGFREGKIADFWPMSTAILGVSPGCFKDLN